MEAARPSRQTAPIDWDDAFVSDLRKGLIACRIFLAYPIIWLCHIQVVNNLVSQAGQMETNGFPNDALMNINPVAVLLLIPVCQKLLYPLLRRAGVRFPPVNRMAIGFMIEAAAIAYCAGVQQMIYSQSPCYRYPLQCPKSQHGSVPNRISVWIQTPTYVLDGLAEIFFDLGSQEYAYNMSPRSMKSIMTAINSASSGIGCALGIALFPITKDPYLVYMYSSLAGTMFVTAIVFWYLFRKYNNMTLKDLGGDVQSTVSDEKSAENDFA